VNGAGRHGWDGVQIPQGAAGHPLAPLHRGRAKRLRGGGDSNPRSVDTEGADPVVQISTKRTAGLYGPGHSVSDRDQEHGGQGRGAARSPTTLPRAYQGICGDGFSGCAGSSVLPPLLDPGPQDSEYPWDENSGQNPSSLPSTPASSPPSSPVLLADYEDRCQWSEWKAEQLGGVSREPWTLAPSVGICLNFDEVDEEEGVIGGRAGAHTSPQVSTPMPCLRPEPRPTTAGQRDARFLRAQLLDI
jgi:hypothetical protein